MGKSKKKKVKKTIQTKEEIFPLIEEEKEADHVVDGFHLWEKNRHDNFNDDLSLDQNDYEVEQEKYAVQSEDTQPIAVDRYFERFGKSRRTPR